MISFYTIKMVYHNISEMLLTSILKYNNKYVLNNDSYSEVLTLRNHPNYVLQLVFMFGFALESFFRSNVFFKLGYISNMSKW